MNAIDSIPALLDGLIKEASRMAEIVAAKATFATGLAAEIKEVGGKGGRK
jgi:hypothetical protein